MASVMEEEISEATQGLFKALENRTLTPEEVKAYIEAGADVNYADIFGDTVLMRAVRTQNPEVIRSLIEAGTDVNAKDKYNIEALNVEYPFGYVRNLRAPEGWTALMQAVDNNCNPVIVKLLLDAGADANAEYEEYNEMGIEHTITVLTLAVRRYCYPETIKMLIKAGADINVRCYYECDYGEYWTNDATLLMLATKYGDSEIIRILADAGVDMDTQDNEFDETALMWALRQDNNEGEDIFVEAEVIDIVNALLESGADVNIADSCGKTALMTVASGEIFEDEESKISERDNIEILKALIRAGADVNAKDKWGRTALTYAYDYEIIEILLSTGFDVNAVSSKGVTALMVACEYGNMVAIKALIKAGVRVNARDNNGNTALMHAVRHNATTEIIKALIRAGANVNAKDFRIGKTILMEAAMKSINPDTLKILIRAGADFTAKDKIGSSVNDYAELNPNSEILNFLGGLSNSKEE